MTNHQQKSHFMNKSGRLLCGRPIYGCDHAAGFSGTTMALDPQLITCGTCRHVYKLRQKKEARRARSSP